MKRLCGADTLVRRLGSGINPRDGRGRPSLHRERLLFAGEGARATWFLLIAVLLLPSLAHAYAGPGAGFAVLSSFWAIFVAFLSWFYPLITCPSGSLSRFIEGR